MVSLSLSLSFSLSLSLSLSLSPVEVHTQQGRMHEKVGRCSAKWVFGLDRVS